MPTYKLIYFNGKGRAEVARWIFIKNGVEFEDKRMDQEAWMAIRETTPFGQLPLLEADGVVISQTQAIIRFLGRRYGLYGQTDVESALIDAVLGSIEDTLDYLKGVFGEKDEAKKEELRKNFEETRMPTCLGYMEKMLISNEGGDGYFVGNSMTIADMYFAHSITLPAMCKVDTKLANFPKLQALQKRVESDPKIADWIKKRPETPF